jgi:thymidylate synthase (FAD)
MINSYDVEVKLIAITGLVNLEKSLGKKLKGPDCEGLIEYAGRLCWGTTARIETNPERIQDWINIGHESVIEHASASFYIRASRAFTHELVRHRLASYSQRSQRYVKELEPKYVTPPEMGNANSECSAVFEKAMQEAWLAYRKLLELGLKPEIVRYVLPNACETQIIMTMNFRELRHFIKLRTTEKALPEMRAIAREIRKIMKKQAPRVFADC